MARSTFPISASGSIFRWWFLPALRTLLAAPLRQQGELIGIMGARRTEVRPFTPAQIKLLETFADQAVIALENVRLFKEFEKSNRKFTNNLEQQTATSEILGVIASSPTDIQPVLDAVAENAARLAGQTMRRLFTRVDGEFDPDLAHMAHAVGQSERIASLSREMLCG